MSSIRTRMRAVAATAACTTAAVVALATPSSADPISITWSPQPILQVLDALVDVGNPGDWIDPGTIPGCNPSSDTYYCVAKGATVLGPLVVPTPTLTSQNVTNVVGYIDVYRVDANVVGGDLLTCVSLTTPVPVNPCGGLGLPLVSRTALVNQPVNSYQPALNGSPITSVTVCRADVTGKVAGREFWAQALTVC